MLEMGKETQRGKREKKKKRREGEESVRRIKSNNFPQKY